MKTYGGMMARAIVCVVLGAWLADVLLTDTAAETGMARWFSCGIGFWGPCVPPPDPAPPAPPRSG